MNTTNFTFTPGQTGSYLLQAQPVIFGQFPLNFGPAREVTVISIVMGQPAVTNGIVQLPFTVSGPADTFHLLQVNQLGAAWTTNSLATLTTNIPGQFLQLHDHQWTGHAILSRSNSIIRD